MQDVQLVPQTSIRSSREGQQSWKREQKKNNHKKKQGEASPLSKWPIAISEDQSVPGGHSSCSERAAGALCLQHQQWGDSKLPNSPYIKMSSTHGK